MYSWDMHKVDHVCGLVCVSMWGPNVPSMIAKPEKPIYRKLYLLVLVDIVFNC